MKAITFCCAPAPMESMATTAATPNIIPSMVRRERSLWLAKFSKPKARSGSHCSRDLDSAMEVRFMGVRFVSVDTRTQGRTCTAAFFRLPCAFLFRIHQRYNRSDGEAVEDRPSFAEGADFYFLDFE